MSHSHKRAAILTQTRLTVLEAVSGQSSPVLFWGRGTTVGPTGHSLPRQEYPVRAKVFWALLSLHGINAAGVVVPAPPRRRRHL
jgi:hypothetical protein